MSKSKLVQIYDELCLTSVFYEVMKKPLFQAFSAYVKETDEEEKQKLLLHLALLSDEQKTVFFQKVLSPFSFFCPL